MNSEEGANMISKAALLCCFTYPDFNKNDHTCKET